MSFSFLVGIGQVLFPARLSLDAAGFSFKHLFWTEQHQWSEIEDVWLVSGFCSQLLVWRLKKRPQKVGFFAREPVKPYDGFLNLMWHGQQTEIALRMIAALETDSKQKK